jgi:ribonuclease-3
MNGVGDTIEHDGMDAAELADLPSGPLADSDDDRPARFAEAIGVRFKDLGILRTALTHRSVLHQWASAGLLPATLQSNERLEFLGDAILGAVAAEDLYHRYPDADEGALTRMRVALVRAETLVRWARQIDLGDYLFLGVGERVTEGARDRMLAGAFEAVVGAIFLDRGRREARRFVRPFLAQGIQEDTSPPETNPKGVLQEILQERFRRSPSYRILQIEGPDHARIFTVEASLEDRVLGTGQGPSKRDAEQQAARAALDTLSQETLPPPLPNHGSSTARRKRGRAKTTD